MRQVTYTGTLGKDAELKTLENGRKVASFSLATSYSKKKSDGSFEEVTVWVKCTKWFSENQSIKIVDFLKKGTKVFLQGEPKPEAYARENGDIVVNEGINIQILELMGNKNSSSNDDNNASSQTNGSQSVAAGMNSSEEDDLPF